MTQKERGEALLRIHPLPTLVAQAVQLASLAGAASPDAKQALAKSALVFAAMSLECAATSCLELVNIPKAPHGKIDRTLSVVDKFDVLHWFAVRAPLNRGQHIVQKIDELVAARNALVHPRVRREPIGASRNFSVGEAVEAQYDKSNWNALRIPKEERSWDGEHALLAVKALVDFLNYFFFDACKIEHGVVVRMLCASSGSAVFHTPWESQVLSDAVRRYGLELRFLGF